MRSNISLPIPGGSEEFLVLEGIFQDKHGNYPVGTYTRNPPRHTPRSDRGWIFLTQDSFQESGELFQVGSWLRSPPPFTDAGTSRNRGLSIMAKTRFSEHN